jgi:hypothetical protein
MTSSTEVSILTEDKLFSENIYNLAVTDNVKTVHLKYVCV